MELPADQISIDALIAMEPTRWALQSSQSRTDDVVVLFLWTRETVLNGDVVRDLDEAVPYRNGQSIPDASGTAEKIRRTLSRTEEDRRDRPRVL